MTTNLSPQAKDKWAEVVACRSTPEKIKLMREFVALCPKHKGTSRLLANVKQRIVALEQELEKTKARRRGGGGRSFLIPKEGAGQIVILGPTNVGKSNLVSSITNAKPEVSSFPFTTRNPVPGMVQYQNIQFQLVEAPALVEGAAEGQKDGPRILDLARNSDGLILMVDLTQNPVEQLEMLKSELEKAGILIEDLEGHVEVQRRSVGSGLQVVGTGIFVDCTLEDVKNMLLSYKIRSALIKVRGKVKLDDIEDALFSNPANKPALIIANKSDAVGSIEVIHRLSKAVKGNMPVLTISCEKKQGLEGIGENLFQMLKIIRVYCKTPSEKRPSEKPLIMKKGATVIQVAQEIYHGLYKNFKYARIWGVSAKYPGEKVGPEHEMKDGDIIQFI